MSQLNSRIEAQHQNTQGERVWGVDKKRSGISFIMPAYNCENTIAESVESIYNGNFAEGDELIIVNDGSTDNTEKVLQDLQKKYPTIRIVQHLRNKGGAAARNTAVENTANPILFCLDSDNILVPGSIPRLMEFMISSDADVAAFQEQHFFKQNTAEIPFKWVYKEEPYAEEPYTLAEHLCGGPIPSFSGNYMFTRESWERANGYPEGVFMDTWGFGFRQVATGSKMICMPNSYYFHRYGHESYWVRESKVRNLSLTVLQVILPFFDLIDKRDIDYIMSRKGRYTWFDNLVKHPIRLKTGEVGKAVRTGRVVSLQSDRIPPTHRSVTSKITMKVATTIRKVLIKSK